MNTRISNIFKYFQTRLKANYRVENWDARCTVLTTLHGTAVLRLWIVLEPMRMVMSLLSRLVASISQRCLQILKRELSIRANRHSMKEKRDDHSQTQVAIAKTLTDSNSSQILWNIQGLDTDWKKQFNIYLYKLSTRVLILGTLLKGQWHVACNGLQLT